MLAEKTLDQPIYVEMRLVDQADKLERLLLSEEEIAALEKLAISGEFDSEKSNFHKRQGFTEYKSHLIVLHTNQKVVLLFCGLIPQGGIKN